MAFALLMVTAQVQAQKLDSAKPYGSKGQYTLTPTNDTITITPKYSASNYACEVDTTLHFNVVTTQSLPLNLLNFELKADATKRYIYFDVGFQGVPVKDSIAANKTKIYTFMLAKNGKFTLLGRSTEY